MQLNELAFDDGKRAISLGIVSELFPENTPAEVDIELKHLEDLLSRHDLILQRSREEPKEVYAVQTLKYRETDFTWLANGILWVSKITTVALEMVVPAVIGMWLDQKLETQFLSLIGLVLGVPVGIWHLLKMTRRTRSTTKKP